jgi:type II secretory pathway component PulM
MREAFEEWWADVPHRQRQALLVLGFILLGILVFLAGNAIGEVIGSIFF